MQSRDPRSISRTSSDTVSIVMKMIKAPTSKTGRYSRWIKIGWRPVLFSGNDLPPVQDKFKLKVTIHQGAGEQVDVWADAGESLTDTSLLTPYMEVCLHVIYDPTKMPACLWDIAAALHQTVRHEIEHLLDEGHLALPGPSSKRKCDRLPGQETWQQSIRLLYWIRKRIRLFSNDKTTRQSWEKLDKHLLNISSADSCSALDYIISPREMHAFVKGFQAEAKFRGVPWDVPMFEYVDSMQRGNKMTHKDANTAKSMLTKWALHVIPYAPIREATLECYL